jgi:hypothetical protein
MSVFLEDALIACAQQPADMLQGEWACFFVAAITAGWARQCGQGVVPTPTEKEPAHADVRGSKRETVRRRLADPAEWIIPPSNVNDPPTEA